MGDEMSEILPGAEPMSADGGPVGVLVIHGFTGNPSSMRPLAEAFVAAGYTVEMPLLPGHGTTPQDMATTGWADWSAAVDKTYADLAGRVERVVVVGLSMGGSLTCWLAIGHPELAGIVCVNPAVAPQEEMKVGVAALIDAGEEFMDGIGSDVAKEGVTELSYDRTPLRPLLTMFDASAEIVPQLGSIRCPLLLMNAPQDHVVPPSDSDLLAASVSGPVERVSLDRSYHVATIDHDQDLIIDTSLEFVARVAS